MSKTRADADELIESTFRQIESEIGKKIHATLRDGSVKVLGLRRINRQLDDRLQFEVEVKLDVDGHLIKASRAVLESYIVQGDSSRSASTG
ncbi:hypothetical protein QNA23_20415 [Rhodococcus erythropolis]|uniref:hypothetical protein n=1 Tax=Rhodococcus erythropolis TaxID=1833 RepID=UPI0024B8BBBB|nr:hypothetical protein [Rhodococcus erythropolis]MDJ0405869.1 hypothetical protein [Rhodococcus erythropolis]